MQSPEMIIERPINKLKKKKKKNELASHNDESETPGMVTEAHTVYTAKVHYYLYSVINSCSFLYHWSLDHLLKMYQRRQSSLTK